MRRRIRLVMMIRQMIVGGAERQLINLVAGLDRERYDIRLCLFKDTCAQRDVFRKLGIPITVIEKRVKFDFGHLFRLVAWLRRTRPDIVHTWITEANTVGTLAAKLAGVPVRVGCVLLVNFWKTRPRLAFDHFAMGASHRLVTNSRQINEFLAGRMRIPPSLMQVIYNGVETGDFRLEGDHRRRVRRAIRAEYGIGAQETLFIMVAGLRRMKNHLDFLRTVARLPRDAGYRFLFLGEGELRAAIDAEVSALGLGETVIMAGMRTDVGALLAASDVFVLPSIVEGLPNAILEAMAAGLPVIATDVGGNAEAVEHGEQGLIVPFGDRPAMVDALIKLGSDPAERARMGRQGLPRVEKAFTIRRMLSQFEDLYKELLGRPTRRHRQIVEGDTAWES